MCVTSNIGRRSPRPLAEPVVEKLSPPSMLRSNLHPTTTGLSPIPCRRCPVFNCPTLVLEGHCQIGVWGGPGGYTELFAPPCPCFPCCTSPGASPTAPNGSDANSTPTPRLSADPAAQIEVESQFPTLSSNAPGQHSLTEVYVPSLSPEATGR